MRTVSHRAVREQYKAIEHIGVPIEAKDNIKRDMKRGPQLI